MALTPDFSGAHRIRGRYLERAGDIAAAETAFREAIRLDPKSPAAFNSLGNLLYREGDLARAAEMFEKSLALDPENRYVLAILPQIYMSLGQKEDTIRITERFQEWAKRHLEFNPDDLDARLSAATGLLGLGQREKAFEWVESAVDNVTNDALLLYNSTCFYSVAGEIDLAFDYLEKSFAAGKADPEWLRQDSDFDNLRGDPRFEEIVRRMESN